MKTHYIRRFEFEAYNVSAFASTLEGAILQREYTVEIDVAHEHGWDHTITEVFDVLDKHLADAFFGARLWLRDISQLAFEIAAWSKGFFSTTVLTFTYAKVAEGENTAIVFAEDLPNYSGPATAVVFAAEQSETPDRCAEDVNPFRWDVMGSGSAPYASIA